LMRARGLTFSVSHADGMAAFAFTRNRMIGVDVESIRKSFDTSGIAERFFSEAERAALQNLPAHKRHQAFFRCWTRKEAYIKALGEGLSYPLHRFDVSISENEPALLATRPNPAEAGRWLLRTLPVPAGYEGVLAVEADNALAMPS